MKVLGPLLNNLRVGQGGGWHAIVSTVIRVAWSVKIVASRVLWLWGLRLNGFCWVTIKVANVSLLLYSPMSVARAVHQHQARRHKSRTSSGSAWIQRLTKRRN